MPLENGPIVMGAHQVEYIVRRISSNGSSIHNSIGAYHLTPAYANNQRDCDDPTILYSLMEMAND